MGNVLFEQDVLVRERKSHGILDVFRGIVLMGMGNNIIPLDDLDGNDNRDCLEACLGLTSGASIAREQESIKASPLQNKERIFPRDYFPKTALRCSTSPTSLSP